MAMCMVAIYSYGYVHGGYIWLWLCAWSLYIAMAMYMVAIYSYGYVHGGYI